MELDDNDKSKNFVAQVNAAQQGLYAYILSLVPNPHDARDVLADTNMALWQKRDQSDSGRDFWPWACRFRKQRLRDRLVFSEDVIHLLAAESAPAATRNEEVLNAMDAYLGFLKTNHVRKKQFLHRQIDVVQFYGRGLGEQAIRYLYASR